MTNHRFLVMDYEGGFETARRLREDGNEVYYYSQREKAYPEWLPMAIGDGFGFPRVKHWADVIDKVDYLVFPEIGYGPLVDWLRERGYKVFGPNKRGELLENDRMHAKRVMQELGIKFPKSYQATGIPEVISYLNDHKGSHYLKLSQFRGDLETVKVESADEAKAFLYNLYAVHGPHSEVVPVIIEDQVDGCYIGQDMFFNGKKFVRPFIFGFEDFGSDALEKAACHSPFDETFDKLGKYLASIDYRGPFSMEAILDEQGNAYSIDPTARFPFTLSMIYMNHLRNFGDVIVACADGKDIEPVYDSTYAVNLNMMLQEKTQRPRWFTVEYPEDVKPRFMNAMRMNGKTYVHNDREHTPVIIMTGMASTVSEACDQALMQMGKVKTIHGVYNDTVESTFKVEYIESYEKTSGETF